MVWIFFVGLVLAAFTLAYVLTLVVSSRVQIGVSDDDAITGIKLQGIYSLYAVVLGFSILATWQFYIDAANSVREEGSNAAVVIRVARSLPPQYGEPILNDMRTYLTEIMASDFSVAVSESPTVPGRAALQIMTNKIVALPAEGSIGNIQTELLYASGELDRARATRLDYVQPSAPSFVWALLAVGGFIVVSLSALLHFKSRRTQAAAAASMAVFISMSLFTVYALDHPYSAPFPVSKVPIQNEIDFVTSVK